LLLDSLKLMLLAAVAPEGWAALAVVVGFAVAAHRRARRDDPDRALPARRVWMFGLALLGVIPVGLLIAASQLGGTPEAGSRDMDATYYLLTGVVVAQLALAAALIWRHRQRWLPTVVVAGALCWWSLGAACLAFMAITDNWL
jgi:hypothetical protein